MDLSPDGYEDAVFISYTHVDNQPFGPEHLRWISHLEEQLTCRVEQLYGERATVWRDEKIHGNDVFAESLVERLATVAVFDLRVLAALPPLGVVPAGAGGVHPLRAEAGLGMQVGAKSSVFKVMKTPVPLHEQPQPLRSFWATSSTRSRLSITEFVSTSSTPTRRSAGSSMPGWTTSRRTSPDCSRTWRATSTWRGGPASGRTIYLAESASDVGGHRDNVEARARAARTSGAAATRAALGGRGPDGGGEPRSGPLGAVDPPLGDRYGARPEEEKRSIPHVQIDLANALAAERWGSTQLIWLPEALGRPTRPRRPGGPAGRPPNIGSGVEIVRSPLETFKAYVLRPDASLAVATRRSPRSPQAPEGVLGPRSS